MSIVSILAAVFILGLLIFIHEFGHFIIARKNGIRVIEFAIGMGPTIFSFGKKNTKYAIKLLPFGGYCRMQGFEDEQLDDEAKAELNAEESFENKSVWARISVVAAGPIFNFVLAFVLAIFVIGFVGYDPATVLNVEKDSPAAIAGLQEGDVITKYDGAGIVFGREIYLREFIHPITSEKDVIKIEYKRNGKKYTAAISPKEVQKYIVGFTYTIGDGPAIIDSVTEGGPLELAGVKAGDIILSVNGAALNTSRELNTYFDTNPIGKEAVEIVIKRGGEEFTVNVTPQYAYSYYNTGFVYNTYREKTNAWGIIKYSFREVKYQISTVFNCLGLLFTGRLTANDFTGPVGIADVVNDTYQASKSEGFLFVLLNFANLATMLSANLGVMNLLPIPGLDGGRLVFLIIEAIRRKPIDKKKEGMIHVVGMLLLMAFAMYVLFHDITSLFK